MKIVSVALVGRGCVTVVASFEDETTVDLFEFYSDELSFTASEFVGLTRSEAAQLFHAKDVAYLRS